MFRHYRFFLREFVVSALLSYTNMSNTAVGNTVYNLKLFHIGFIVNRTILCLVDRVTLYNLVNKSQLGSQFFFVCVFLSISISFSTCFGQLCAHHQEIQLCLCDTWYLLFCVDNCLVCRVESTLHTRQSCRG